jgi:hypothetical protein
VENYFARRTKAFIMMSKRTSGTLKMEAKLEGWKVQPSVDCKINGAKSESSFEYIKALLGETSQRHREMT